MWDLTHALVRLELKVGIICEQVYGSPCSKIEIHTVAIRESPSRWRSMLSFRDKVNNLITNKFADRRLIIHSHERSINHQITTFHGPPMIIKTEWWRFSWLSSRIKAWRIMEKDEIMGPRVTAVLPVSNRIKEQLFSLYPSVKDKNVVIAYPGVHQIPSNYRTHIRNKQTSNQFVFIGKEWKRKGLRFAIELIEYYAAHFNNCTMDIYGPNISDLPRSIRQHPNLVVKGWIQDIPWSNYDALIHPATNEPFGMVIPEARSRGIPVLTTNLVGSAELDFQGVIALDTSEPIKIWAENLTTLIEDETNRHSEIKWTWHQLALQHLNDVYLLAN